MRLHKYYGDNNLKIHFRLWPICHGPLVFHGRTIIPVYGSGSTALQLFHPHASYFRLTPCQYIDFELSILDLNVALTLFF